MLDQDPLDSVQSQSMLNDRLETIKCELDNLGRETLPGVDQDELTIMLEQLSHIKKTADRLEKTCRQIKEKCENPPFVSECSSEVKRRFIRKVYALLVVQLLVLYAIALKYGNTPYEWYEGNKGIVGLLPVVTAYRRILSSEANPRILILSVHFLTSRALVDFLTRFNYYIYPQAIYTATVAFVGLTLFSFQTRYNYTQWQAYAVLTALTVLGTAMVPTFAPYNAGYDLFFSWAISTVFSAYINYDTQIITARVRPGEVMAAAVEQHKSIYFPFRDSDTTLHESQQSSPVHSAKTGEKMELSAAESGYSNSV